MYIDKLFYHYQLHNLYLCPPSTAALSVSNYNNHCIMCLNVLKFEYGRMHYCKHTNIHIFIYMLLYATFESDIMFISLEFFTLLPSPFIIFIVSITYISYHHTNSTFSKLNTPFILHIFVVSTYIHNVGYKPLPFRRILGYSVCVIFCVDKQH